MLVELPIWIIKHEKNLFLCISEPSAFYPHFMRPIPVCIFLTFFSDLDHLKKGAPEKKSFLIEFSSTALIILGIIA